MIDCILDPADIPIIRGNNWPPAKWQFLVSENPDVLFDLSGSVFKLTVSIPGSAALIKTSGVDPELVVDLPTSMLTWNYTIAESRTMPVGRTASYEVERWIGATQQTLVRGRFVVSEGDNPD